MAAAGAAIEVHEVEPTPSPEASREELSVTILASEGTTTTDAAGATRASPSTSASNDPPARGGRSGPNGGNEPESSRRNGVDDGDGGGAALRLASSPVPSASGAAQKTLRNTSGTGPSAGASSECARRWSKLRLNFRLAALRSIAQDKREALKKLQEVRKRADRAQEAQSDSRTCKICWDRATNTVCLDCGHQCMCTRCGACMTFCPICMQDISDLVELQL